MSKIRPRIFDVLPNAHDPNTLLMPKTTPTRTLLPTGNDIER